MEAQVADKRAESREWDRLAQASAAVDLGVIAGLAALHGEREAVVLAALIVVGAVALRSDLGRTRRLVLGFVFVDIAGWMLPAAVTGMAHHDALGAIAVTLSLSMASLTGLTALAAPLLRARAAGTHRAVAVAAAAVFALGLSGASLAGIGHTTAATAGDLRLSARDTAFSPDHLLAPAGLVTIRLTNHDLFWHTFTVRGLGADSKVPVGGTRRVTFRAQRGTYQFVCRIPGHKQAGMQGTLIVQ